MGLSQNRDLEIIENPMIWFVAIPRLDPPKTFCDVFSYISYIP